MQPSSTKELFEILQQKNYLKPKTIGWGCLSGCLALRNLSAAASAQVSRSARGNRNANTHLNLARV
jgi:hypothetical protein